jgi:uncharacterized membrane-anchored protein YhcB (DUF1043 family)
MGIELALAIFTGLELIIALVLYFLGNRFTTKINKQQSEFDSMLSSFQSSLEVNKNKLTKMQERQIEIIFEMYEKTNKLLEGFVKFINFLDSFNEPEITNENNLINLLRQKQVSTETIDDFMLRRNFTQISIWKLINIEIDEYSDIYKEVNCYYLNKKLLLTTNLENIYKELLMDLFKVRNRIVELNTMFFKSGFDPEKLKELLLFINICKGEFSNYSTKLEKICDESKGIYDRDEILGIN